MPWLKQSSSWLTTQLPYTRPKQPCRKWLLLLPPTTGTSPAHLLSTNPVFLEQEERMTERKKQDRTEIVRWYRRSCCSKKQPGSRAATTRKTPVNLGGSAHGYLRFCLWQCMLVMFGITPTQRLQLPVRCLETRQSSTSASSTTRNCCCPCH